MELCTRIRNIDLNGYTIGYTPSEASCGGAVLFNDNSLSYTVGNNITICKKKELESIFIEVIIYWHLWDVNPSEFIDVYISDLLQKNLKEDKAIILMSDFNMDLLKQGIF